MGLLFTTIKNETIHKSPERIIHEEHRAPTDDSIQLAKEYEEKIHSQISEKLIVNNNLFTYSLAFSKDTFYHTKLYIKIKINESEFSHVFNLDSFSSVKPEDIVKTITSWLCEKVLTDPIQKIFELHYSNNTMNYKVIDNEFIYKNSEKH